MRNHYSRWLFAALLVAPLFGHSASFDCGKAGTPVEKMICANEELSRLDDALAETYSLEVDSANATANLRGSQKAWLTSRNMCRDIACIRQNYEQRLADLFCSKSSLLAGSAMGSNQCAWYSLRLLDAKLAKIEERYGREAAAGTNNPEYTHRAFVEEQRAWRFYRQAQCTFYGATEGGLDGWKNAFAAMCEVDETKKRISRLQKEVGER